MSLVMHQTWPEAPLLTVGHNDSRIVFTNHQDGTQVWMEPGDAESFATAIAETVEAFHAQQEGMPAA